MRAADVVYRVSVPLAVVHHWSAEKNHWLWWDPEDGGTRAWAYGIGLLIPILNLWILLCLIGSFLLGCAWVVTLPSACFVALMGASRALLTERRRAADTALARLRAWEQEGYQVSAERQCLEAYRRALDRWGREGGREPEFDLPAR